MIAIPTLSIRAWSTIGLGVALAIALVALFATRATLADEKREHAQVIAAHSATRASLGRVEKEIDRMTTEQKALANSDANRINASRQIVQMADAVAKVRQAAINRLEQSAENMMGATPENLGQCDAPIEVLEDWAA